MSSRQYSVVIKLKDDGLLKKLENINGPSIGGKSSMLGPSSGGDIFRKIEALDTGQLLKLGGIAGGVAALVSLTVKSSGILQSQMKLWETGMMLIFKPIGDFIGLALRPITMALLTQMIVPFYKSMYPFFRDHGKAIGQFFSDPSKALMTLAEAIGGTVALALASKGIGIPTPSVPSTLPPSAPSVSGGCVELCDKTPGKFVNPVAEGVKQGIGNAAVIGTMAANTGFLLTMNSSLLDMKTDLNIVKGNTRDLLEKLQVPSTLTPNTSIAVNLSDNLDITDIIGSDVTSGIKSDWGQAAIASASVAAAAAEAARHLDEAKIALGGAVARLQSYAGSIPNQFSWGFAQFGVGGGATPVGMSRARTQMAGIADAVNI